MKRFFIDFDGWFEIHAEDKEKAKAEFLELWTDFVDIYCNRYDFDMNIVDVEEG